MDTKYLNVVHTAEALLTHHLRDADQDAAEMLRDLAAERDTLKALCVELVAELERWCSEDCDTTSGNLLTRARSILK